MADHPADHQESGTKDITAEGAAQRLDNREEQLHMQEIAAGLMTPEQHQAMHDAQTTDTNNVGG